MIDLEKEKTGTKKIIAGGLFLAAVAAAASLSAQRGMTSISLSGRRETVGTPIEATLTPRVRFESSCREFPTPLPGAIPDELICMLLPMLRGSAQASASQTMTCAGLTFEHTAAVISALSSPV